MLSSVASTPSSFKAATVLSTTSNETYPIAPGVAATLASTAPVLSSSCAYAHLFLTSRSSSNAPLVPDAASLPITTIASSEPPRSFQLVILPV